MIGWLGFHLGANQENHIFHLPTSKTDVCFWVKTLVDEMMVPIAFWLIYSLQWDAKPAALDLGKTKCHMQDTFTPLRAAFVHIKQNIVIMLNGKSVEMSPFPAGPSRPCQIIYRHTNPIFCQRFLALTSLPLPPPSNLFAQRKKLWFPAFKSLQICRAASRKTGQPLD